MPPPSCLHADALALLAAMVGVPGLIVPAFEDLKPQTQIGGHKRVKQSIAAEYAQEERCQASEHNYTYPVRVCGCVSLSLSLSVFVFLFVLRMSAYVRVHVHLRAPQLGPLAISEAAT